MDLHIKRHQLSRADEGVVALKQIMRDAEMNRALLLKYVLDGKRKFIQTVGRELRGMAVTEDMIQSVWIWMFFRRGPDPKAEFETLCEQATQRKWKQEAEEAELAQIYDKARRRMD